MKFKTYKKVDLAALCILAFVIEILATYAASAFIPTMAPYPVIGALLTLVAITRWGPIGLIVGLFSTLGNFLCGILWLPQEVLRSGYYYTWVIGLFGNLSVACVLPLFKKKGREYYFKTIGNLKNLLLTIILTDFLVSFIILFFYNVFSGTLSDKFFSGVAQIILAAFTYGAFGYLVLIIGTLVLRSQSVLVDVKAKILSNQRENESEKKYYSKIGQNSGDDEDQKN